MPDCAQAADETIRIIKLVLNIAEIQKKAKSALVARESSPIHRNPVKSEFSKTATQPIGRSALLNRDFLPVLVYKF